MSPIPRTPRLPTIVLTSVLVASACVDGTGVRSVNGGTGGRPPETSVGLIVSSPVRPPTPAAPGTAPAASSSAAVVYVSLPPGSVPAGVHATITNQATGQSVTTIVVSGGFDPVPLGASVGDTLVTVIADAAADTVAHVRLAVTPIRPLKLVRTSPPSGGRDVPLNASIVVVFSEPIDAATLTTGAVQLLRDTTQVPGTLRFADSTHLRAEFYPADLLAPQTEYRLVITRTIRDVNGVAIDSPLDVPFTTGTATSAPLSLSATSMVFGNQTISTTSGPRTLTLTNPGTASEPVSIVMNGFSYTDFAPTSDCPAELAGGGTCTISITFTPGSIGHRIGILVIDGDLPQGMYVNVDGTGTGGLSMAVVPDPSGKFGKFAYVANSGFDNVSMYGINPSTGALTPLAPPRIAAGTQPASVAVDPSGKFAYVANFGSNTVSMFTIDTSTGALTPIGSPVPAGSGPVSVAVAPAASGKFAKFAYVANRGSNDVSMYSIDSATGALTPMGSPVTAQFRPISVAVQISGNSAYVATDGCPGTAQTCVLMFTINAATGALTPAGVVSPGSWSPASIAVDPSGRSAALIDGASKDVWVFSVNATTGALTETAFASTLPSPTAVAIDPSGKFVYVTTAGPDSPPSPQCSYSGCSGVSMFTIDTSMIGTNPNAVFTFKGTFGAGSYPTSIAIDQSGKFAYVASFGSQTISMYSIATDGSLTLIGKIGT